MNVHRSTSETHPIKGTLKTHKCPLRVNAAATGVHLDSKVAHLLKDARQILRDCFQDDITTLKLMADFSTSYISFCEFLISRGDEIPWEDCVKFHESLSKTARELSKKAQELSKKAACSLHEYEKLREELRACSDSLSNFLRSSSATNQDRHWFKYIKDILGAASREKGDHDLVDSLDCALEDMIAHQRSIAQFWEDQESSLAALNPSSVHSKAHEPEHLHAEISRWRLIESDFLTAVTRFPTSVDSDIASDEHTADTIISSPITPYLSGLVKNADNIKSVLSTIRCAVVSSPPAKLNTVVSETCMTVSAGFIKIKRYLGTCNTVAHAYYTFYELHLLLGTKWHSTLELLSGLTRMLFNTVRNELDDWILLRLNFKKNSRRLSTFLSKNSTERSQARRFRLSQHVKAQLASPELDHETIQAYIEGATNKLHPDVIDYDIAHRNMHRYTSSLYVFWKEQETRLDTFALALENGIKSPTRDRLRCEMNIWTTLPAPLSPTVFRKQ